MKDLVQEMHVWQKEQYLDRRMWTNNIFSPSLLPGQSSVGPDKAESDSRNPAEISDQERMAFEKEDLDPKIWVPKLYEHFNIDNLKLLKNVGRDRITGFLDGIKNSTTREALRVLLRELRCLYIPSFELKHLTDLPDVMDKRMRYLTLNRDDEETKCNELVDQLECTIWKLHQSSNQSYEFLTCLATMNLFDLSLEQLIFNNGLQEKEIENLSITLRQNFDELQTLRTIVDNQAFVLNIALNNPLNKCKSVPFILERLPNEISHQFTGCTGQKYNLSDLHKAVQQLITRKDELKEKAKSLSMHFNSAFSRKFSSSKFKEELPQVNESVRKLLEELGLTEYYPQKLTYNDVIKITEDALTNVHQKPSTLPELPWYFLRRLIELNSAIREEGTIVGQKKERKRKKNEKERNDKKKRKLNEVEDEEITFSWDEDSTDEGTEDDEAKAQNNDEKEVSVNVINSVHPLDLIYIIFLCADDFLRQELADKMSKCQYAVPFILPSPAEKGNESMNTVLHWGLQTICRTFRKEKGTVMTKNLTNISCPLVSFLSLNINSTWMSRLLNKMLSPQQETFWHEDLEGGKCQQKVSRGMVVVSCYLPAGRGNDQFKTPVTFASLRGDAQKYPIVTENLTNLSTTTCIFTDRINKDVVAFLEKYFGRKYLKKIVLVVMFNPAEEQIHSKNCKKLKANLKLDYFQIINCPLEDSSFHTAYDCLKTSLQNFMEETTSLSKFIAEVKSNGCMKVDDEACSQGYKTAHIESDDVKSKILLYLNESDDNESELELNEMDLIYQASNDYDDNESEVEEQELNIYDDNESEVEEQELNIYDDSESEVEEQGLNIYDDNELEVGEQDIYDENESEVGEQDIYDENESEVEEQGLNIYDDHELEVGEQDIYDENESEVGEQDIYDENESEVGEQDIYDENESEVEEQELNVYDDNGEEE